MRAYGKIKRGAKIHPHDECSNICGFDMPRSARERRRNQVILMHEPERQTNSYSHEGQDGQDSSVG